MPLGAPVSSTVQSFLHQVPGSPAAPLLVGSPPHPNAFAHIGAFWRRPRRKDEQPSKATFGGFMYLIRLERAEIVGGAKRTSSRSATKLALNVNIRFGLWLQTLKGCLRGRLAEWSSCSCRPEVWMMDTPPIVGHSLAGQWSWRITLGTDLFKDRGSS